MSSPFICAQADLTAGVDNTVWTADVPRTHLIYLCNRSGSPVAVSIALLPNGTNSTSNASWIEYQVPYDGNMPVERNGIPLGAGDKIVIHPSASGISCTVIGIPI